MGNSLCILHLTTSFPSGPDDAAGLFILRLFEAQEKRAVSFELKMFLSSLENPIDNFRRYLEMKNLQKYLIKRDSLLCISSLSFIFDPDIDKFQADRPHPIAPEKYGLPSGWALNFLILDKNAIDAKNADKHFARTLFHEFDGQSRLLKSRWFPGTNLNMRITYNFINKNHYRRNHATIDGHNRIF